MGDMKERGGAARNGGERHVCRCAVNGEDGLLWQKAFRKGQMWCKGGEASRESRGGTVDMDVWDTEKQHRQCV